MLCIKKKEGGCMRYLLIVVLSSLSIASHSCVKYTEEQTNLLRAAYLTGVHKDYGYTLAAITAQESFVGDSVIRMNPNDPSFGISHISFSTLQSLSNMRYYDTVLEAERLMYDDVLSWHYSMKKLDSIKGSWHNKWKRYNGGGVRAEKYAANIKKLIKEFKECGVLK